ncbi:MAG: Do family serine endopeptidase [Candidatus Omnitrophica bacterium]|nr:Do family serine endopeptidase [Candidatus Omnitrophota bacterium]MDD5591826.1 Do family serine endopeptidase [Candidatus Omnitrophota bacterium]
MKKKIIFFAITLLLGLTMGVISTAKLNLFSPAESQEAKNPSLEGSGMEDAVVNVANIAGKAVVSISTEHTAKIGGGKRFYFNSPFGQEAPFGEDEFFRRFFDEFFGEMPQKEYKQMGLGSGVIIDAEGYILTNEHVVNDADKINVILPDGREFKGELKGKDLRSDLAVIKINARNLPIASLGDSDNLKIGQWVVAIGNPFGFAMQNSEPTVTVGVISALHRSLGRTVSRERDYNDLIQTDTAINPGNSGGPLVNLKGEIVGINVAIFSTSGGYQGIGFAIPINSAKRIISRLIEGKKIMYGWLGVTVQDLTEDLAKHFGLADKNGVLVAKTLENSPAEKGGIKEGDIIKEFDNKRVNNVRELLSIVGKEEVGQKVKLNVIRDKHPVSLEVVIGERPQDLEEKEEAAVEKAQDKWRGLAVEDLNPENIKRFGIEEKRGVVVIDVESNSPVDEAGIIPGDVILELNRQEVNNLADYQKLTKGLKGDCLVKTDRGFFLIKAGG